MTTGSARKAVLHRGPSVTGPQARRRSGTTRDEMRAHLDAHRWQRIGRAVVTHNGPLGREERIAVALANAGPRAVITGVTTAEVRGLEGWEREEIHLLVPAGTHVRRVPGIPVVVHYTAAWDRVETHGTRRIHRLADALVLAAGDFRNPRPACAILAAAVQQRLTTAAHLRSALDRNRRVRHRRQLMLAVDDIAQGAQALSEIDFVRLCRRFDLPPPEQQRIRVERSGRRRYLDASWRRADGRLVTAEVDGAIHLSVARWSDDSLRHNELAIDDAVALRYPSVLLRTEQAIVADQLRRALGLPRCADPGACAPGNAQVRVRASR